MKELSIEEKAKAYDNIIEKANKMHCENCEACQMCIEELIPELKESEDRRIFLFLCKTISEACGINKEDKRRCLDWLKSKNEDTIIKDIDDIADNFSDTCMNEINKQFEQMSESKDENIRKRLLELFKSHHSNEWYGLDVKKVIAWLEKQGEQKPVDVRTTGYWHVEDTEQNSAWGEDDLERIDELIFLIEEAEPYLREHKKFPDIKHESISLIKDWLKSLRPQSHWKPSDEQMVALEGVLTVSPQSPAMTSALIELYEQLKKLREEDI